MPTLTNFLAYLLISALVLVTAGCGESDNQQAEKSDTKKSIKRNGSMNISAFVYRDINRNGIYDLGDRPYAGLQIQLERPEKSAVKRRSNIAGFTNFKMSLDHPAHPIAAPGVYPLSADIPKNWINTSNNASQILEIEELALSPAGLVAKNTLQPIGVAPALTVSGSIAKTGADTMLIARSKSGTTETVVAEDDGWYQFELTADTWDIDYLTGSSETSSRSIVVSNYPVILSSLFNDSTAHQPGLQQRTLHFDDLTTSDTLMEVPNGYADLSWHNWISTHQKLYSGPGYINGATSGEYVLYNSSGHPASFSSVKPFDLSSVMVSVAWTKAEKGLVYFKAWRDNDLVYEDQFYASTRGPISFQPDYRKITKVEISTQHYWQVVLDDMVIRR